MTLAALNECPVVYFRRRIRQKEYKPPVNYHRSAFAVYIAILVSLRKRMRMPRNIARVVCDEADDFSPALAASSLRTVTNVNPASNSNTPAPRLIRARFTSHPKAHQIHCTSAAEPLRCTGTQAAPFASSASPRPG